MARRLPHPVEQSDERITQGCDTSCTSRASSIKCSMRLAMSRRLPWGLFECSEHRQVPMKLTVSRQRLQAGVQVSLIGKHQGSPELF